MSSFNLNLKIMAAANQPVFEFKKEDIFITGAINYSQKALTPSECDRFMMLLQDLMEEYNVTKVDVALDPYRYAESKLKKSSHGTD